MKSALLYTTTVLTGGLVWFATKFQLGVVPPEISLIYRFSVAALLLTGFALVLRQPLKFGIAIHLRLALFGALVFGGNFALLYAAIENLTSGLVAIIFSTSVLMNIAFGIVFLGRKIEGVVVIGALLGVCGLGLIALPRQLLPAVQSSRQSVRPTVISAGMTASILSLWRPANPGHAGGRELDRHPAMRPTRTGDEACAAAARLRSEPHRTRGSPLPSFTSSSPLGGVPRRPASRCGAHTGPAPRTANVWRKQAN